MPTFVGLNGAQGSGKSTLVSSKPVSKNMSLQRFDLLTSLYLNHVALHYISILVKTLLLCIFHMSLLVLAHSPRPLRLLALIHLSSS